MPSASIIKKIPCSKENLIKMVLDIEKYPEFVPWCLNGKIYSEKDRGSKIEIVADLTIGKNFFKETYKSFIVYDKTLDSILVNNMEGPLKHLENKWKFKDLGNNSEVDFHVNFELKSKVLNLILAKSFDFAIKRIAEAFEKRAIKLFKRA